MMTYDEAIQYIHGISWTFCKPGLERISALCNALGNPQNKLKFIHVAGTNGKGSFCSMLSSVLTAAGYKTGLYTSPFIKVFNERMQIDGVNISNEALADVTERVRPIADTLTDKPTEFELITAIAFLYFAEAGCDIVVLEAGMGGRLDSTNVITTPALSVITGIALDHTAYLGDTVEKIAAEKAGIIKPGVPVLYGGEAGGALSVISSHAEALGSKFYQTERTAIRLKRADVSGSIFDYKVWHDVELRLLGLYQPNNAANVLEAIEILRVGGFNIDEGAVRKGLLSARWPARFEVISSEPLVIFDGAHNPEGISVATASVAHYFKGKKLCVLSGVLRDKDYKFIAGELSKIAAFAFTLTPDSPRALNADEYAEVLREYGVDAIPCPDIKSALDAAYSKAKESGIPLVCLGSLYTYADISAALEEIKQKEK